MAGVEPSPDRPIFVQFREVAERFPDKLAVDDGQIRLTYRELLLKSVRLSKVIDAFATPGAVVGVAVQTLAWLPAALFACFRSGVILVALDTRDPLERQQQILGDASAVLIVTDDGDPRDIPAVVDLQVVMVDPAGDACGPDAVAATRGTPDDPALIIYTSGSTGVPKGIVNSQRAILQRVAQYVGSCHIGEHDALLPLAGLVTIAGYREMFAALLTGAALHLARPEATGVRGLRELCARRRPTLIYAVPSILRVVLSPEAVANFSTLRVLRVGGEEVSWGDIDLARRTLSPACQVQIGYSSTETTGTQWFVPPDFPPEDGPVPIGYVLPGVEYAILDPKGRPAAEGSAGELVIRSPFVALGEWRSGRLWPGHADPSKPSLRIHATGDMARIEADGLLRFIGRNDGQFKVHGIRLESAELEQQLLRLEGVEDACATTATTGELIAFAALVTDRPDAAERTLRAHLRTALPRGLQPMRLHLVPEIPRLASGKVDRAALRGLDDGLVAASSRDQPRDYEVSGSQAEQAVAQAWSTFLPQSRRPDGRWEEEGGDSLTLLNVVLMLERLLGTPLPLERFHPDMSRQDFARVVTSASCNEEEAPPPPPDQPMVYFFPGVVGDIPVTARFRARLAATAGFVAVRYPDLGVDLQRAPSIERMGRAFADDIERLQPEGPVFLVGYSFGGAVAAETAAQLIARSRAIAFLGILDADITGAGESPWSMVKRQRARDGKPRLKTYLEAMRLYVMRATAQAAFALHADGLLTWMSARAPLPAGPRAMLLRRMEAEVRARTFAAWARKPSGAVAVSAVLFRSEQHRSTQLEDMGWGRFFMVLNVVQFGGDHIECLDAEPYASDNSEKFTALIRAASSVARMPSER